MYQNRSERYLTVFSINHTANVCYDFIRMSSSFICGFVSKTGTCNFSVVLFPIRSFHTWMAQNYAKLEFFYARMSKNNWKIVRFVFFFGIEEKPQNVYVNGKTWNSKIVNSLMSCFSTTNLLSCSIQPEEDEVDLSAATFHSDNFLLYLRQA